MSVCKTYKPNHTGITLNVSDPVNTYTTGDTVSGYVALEAETRLLLNEVLVCLKCIETCTLKGLEQQRFIHFREDLDLLQFPVSDKKKEHLILSQGRHDFHFEFFLSERTLGMPPTVSLNNMGAPNSGIEWLIEVCAKVDINNGKELVFLKDTQHLSVQPKVPHEGEDFTELLRSSEKNSDNHSVILHNFPRYVPRHPQTCNIGVDITSSFTAHLESISATLKTIVHLRVPERPDLQTITLSSSTLLNEICNCKLSPGPNQFNGLLENFSLEHCETSAFRSLYVELSYQLVIVLSGFSSYTFDWTVRLMPLWVSRQQQKEIEKYEDRKPPEYSE